MVVLQAVKIVFNNPTHKATAGLSNFWQITENIGVSFKVIHDGSFWASSSGCSFLVVRVIRGFYLIELRTTWRKTNTFLLASFFRVFSLGVLSHYRQ